MNRLCDEILQLILNELDNPTNFSLTSKSIYAFTRVPYVRATYFLSRYGNTHALYYALGRGKLMSKEVIDILLSSGAHFSRYLVQCIIQHYFRSHVPFIKTHWVRTLDFSLVNHLLSIAADRFGDVPVGKGEDDGSSLSALLIESRLPLEHRSVTWEAAKDIVEKYKFMPLCSKDPMMLKFPLVLAVEPRLLPYARANGFIMDTKPLKKYRNFIFRKIFEKSSGVSDSRTHDIVDNVRELSKLDPHMYLTRTVAAEICMECVSNEAGYSALKTLDKEGILKFDLSTVVRDLIKTFATTRSITLPHTPPIIRKLFKDFPSQDLTVHMVLLIQVFREKMYATPEQMSHTARTFWESYVRNCRTRIDELGLGPVKASDLRAVLINRFAPESYLTGILDFARVVMNLSRMEIDNLVQDVSLACLEIGCKGRMLEKLVEKYPFLKDVIRKKVMKEYRTEMDVDGLPDWSVDERKCAMFEARLCRDFIFLVGSSFDGGDILAAAALAMGAGMGGGVGEDVAMGGVEGHDRDEEMEDDDDDDVNYIGQDTLSAMIRRDETHGRRRFYDSHSTHIESSGRLSYPTDYQPLGKAIRGIFGLRSGVTAVYLMHAVANGNPMAIQPYCGFLEEPSPSTQIPVTLKLFKILARLGRAPPSSLIEDIESGAEFFFSEEDYLSADELNGIGPKTRKRKYSRIRVRLVSEYSVKKESVSPAPPSCLPSTSTSNSTLATSSSSGAGSSASARSAVVDVKPPADASSTDTESSPKGKKRPRRSAVVAPKSYYVPDSDDEGIMPDEEDVGAGAKMKSNSLKKVRKAIREESNLQKWIKHLGVLFKEEQKKYNEKKRKAQQAAPPGVKLRFARNDFLRTLSYQLQCLRKRDKEKRQALYGPDVPSEDYSSGEEDEYHERTTRSSKRRRTIA
ncbi:hypothetical protein K474DRAFT_1686956 [Panus rudis PR-1116 ss-1]|nr:hypothetical protein K474DRAFT_1686956 [Panus rudis PR-1116 ss-1]